MTIVLNQGSPRPLHPISYVPKCFEGEGKTSTHLVLEPHV